MLSFVRLLQRSHNDPAILVKSLQNRCLAAYSPSVAGQLLGSKRLLSSAVTNARNLLIVASQSQIYAKYP
jgi:hypothetical protein